MERIITLSIAKLVFFTTVAFAAKVIGYAMVFPKFVAVFGGNDITSTNLKVIK